MDLKKLYDSLSLEEKQELRGYLNDEFIENNDLNSVEWCIRFHPSLRLQNILFNNFKTRRVSTIKKEEFIVTRNAGIISWAELVKLRENN